MTMPSGRRVVKRYEYLIIYIAIVVTLVLLVVLFDV